MAILTSTSSSSSLASPGDPGQTWPPPPPPPQQTAWPQIPPWAPFMPPGQSSGKQLRPCSVDLITRLGV